MSVLDVERPDFMAEEDIRMFEDSVTKFFEQHAPVERVDKWRKLLSFGQARLWPVERVGKRAIVGALGCQSERLLRELSALIERPEKGGGTSGPGVRMDAIAQVAMGDFFISRAPRRVGSAAELRSILDAAW